MRRNTILFFMIFFCFSFREADAVVWPISNSSTPDVLTSCFGPRINPGYQFHYGIDIQAWDGTPVYSIMFGGVFETGYDYNRGNYVIIQNEDYTYASYYHLERIDVEQFDVVPEGWQIGLSGRSGGVDPHLHLNYGDLPNHNSGINALHILPYGDVDWPHIQDVEYNWSGSHLLSLSFSIRTEDQGYSRDQDFNALHFYVYDDFFDQWKSDFIDFDEKRNCSEDFFYFTDAGYIEISPRDYPQGGPRIIDFYWRVIEYSVTNPTEEMALEAWDFEACDDGWPDPNDCEWGNTDFHPPDITIENFSGEVSGSKVIITWDFYLDGIEGFNLHRAKGENNNVFARLNQNLITVLDEDNKPFNSYSFTDTKFTSGGIFYYRLESVDNRGNSYLWDDLTLRVEVNLPGEFAITNVYPNPFNSSANITYTLDGAQPRKAEIRIYDISGRLVRELRNEISGPGNYSLRFSSRNDRGDEPANGIYFLQLRWEDQVATRRLTLLK